MKPKRLGRGLSGLIKGDEESTKSAEGAMPPARTAPPPAPPAAAAADTMAAPPRGPGVQELRVADIRPNPYQPRAAFSTEDLEDLKTSIREHGVLQPIVVRRATPGFEVVAGERRLRAVRALERERVPAIVRDASDEEMQTLALVENIQRVDLNAIEKARAVKAMMRNFEFTQEQVAARVGKARTTIANLLRLLDLPSEVLSLVEEGRLSGAHARAVLQAQGTTRRIELARKAADEGWSVRETERRAAAGAKARPKKAQARDPYVEDIESRVRAALATKVAVKPKGQGGVIELRYHDATELDRLLEIFEAER